MTSLYFCPNGFSFSTSDTIAVKVWLIIYRKTERAELLDGEGVLIIAICSLLTTPTMVLRTSSAKMEGVEKGRRVTPHVCVCYIGCPGD